MRAAIKNFIRDPERMNNRYARFAFYFSVETRIRKSTKKSLERKTAGRLPDNSRETLQAFHEFEATKKDRQIDYQSFNRPLDLLGRIRSVIF